MNRPDGRNHRWCFRLRLPEAAVLKATIFGESFDVIEVAERSLCVTAKDVKSFNGHCAGVIKWSDGSHSNFTGDVGHGTQQGRLIFNVKGVTTRDIVNETRRVIVRFPKWEL
jgi:hypothetical protein